jgi:cellulose synthase operon protein C
LRFPNLARTAPWAAAVGAFNLSLMLFALSGTARGQVPTPPGASLRSVPESLNFANGLYRDRRYDLAAQEYRDFLKTAPPGPDADDARYGLANSELFLNHYKEARRAFEAFLKEAPANNPNFGTATFRVGETAYLLGDLAAARTALEKFVADNPGHRHEETGWSHLADVCLRLDDRKRAREAYEKVLSKPDGRLANRARLGLGRTLAIQGASSEAVKVLSQLAETGGAEWSDKARFEIGKVELGAGRLEQAAAAFDSVETGTPKSPLVPEARLRRAETLGRLGRHDEAEALLRPLVDGPTPTIAAQAADALGASLLARSKPADAFAALDAAANRFAATTVGPLLRFHAAEAAQTLGKLDDARDRFLKVAEVGPDHPLADDALVRAAGIGLEANDLAAAKALAQSLPKKFPRSDRKADARLIEARVALLEKDPKSAIALLETPDAEDKPAVATVQATRYYLALAYRADGQTAKANEILDTLSKTPAALATSGAQFMLGQGLVDAGKFAEALPPLEQYLAGKPNGEYADYALAYVAQAQVGLGKADDARATLETLASRFPQSKALPATRLRLAEAAVEAMAYDRAVELFRQAAEGSDNSIKARARSGLGWALIKLKKPDEAASAYESLLKETPDDPLAPDAALARAQALEAAKQVEPALAAYEVVLSRYAKSNVAGTAALGRARLLVEAKRPAEAMEAFAKVETEYPKAAPPDVLLAERGWALVDLGKTSEADAVFERLLKDFSESPRASDARFNLAESAFAAGQFVKVAPLLAPVVAEGSKARPGLVASSLYRLGRTQAELKDWKGAGETFARLAKEFPDGGYRREAAFWKAEVAFQAGDAKAAEVALAALIAEPAAPDEPASLVRTAKRRRAQALVQLESWKEALAVAESYGADPSPGQADPHRADVEYARGRALQGLARFEDARVAYARVIEARKGSELAAKAQFMRGETCFHQKDYREALREFLKVDYLYDAPTWQASALLEAGKVHEQLGQWAEAAETYERLRSRFPNDPNAAQAQARLEVARKRAEGPAQAGGTTGTELR